jgi:hypothetical protein
MEAAASTGSTQPSEHPSQSANVLAHEAKGVGEPGHAAQQML